VRFRDFVGELAAGHAKRDHKRQVEKEFQRCGGPVHLMRVAAAHACHGVPEGI
jgi:hypothetical protein